MYPQRIARQALMLGLLVTMVVLALSACGGGQENKKSATGDSAAANGQINPILALWVPLVLFAGIIFWMYHVLAHHPGGQPIGALERFFAKVARVARSMLPKPKAPAEGLNPVPTRP